MHNKWNIFGCIRDPLADEAGAIEIVVVESIVVVMVYTNYFSANVNIETNKLKQNQIKEHKWKQMTNLLKLKKERSTDRCFVTDIFRAEYKNLNVVSRPLIMFCVLI